MMTILSSYSYSSLCSACMKLTPLISVCIFSNGHATTEIYTLSLHDALPILSELAPEMTPTVRRRQRLSSSCTAPAERSDAISMRSEEHTSELQSLRHLVCRLLLEKKKSHMMIRRLGRPHMLMLTRLSRMSHR